MFQMWSASVKNNHINGLSNSKSVKAKSAHPSRLGGSPEANSAIECDTKDNNFLEQKIFQVNTLPKMLRSQIPRLRMKA